jgi:hypothetical protein
MNNKKELNDKLKLETGNIFGDDILPSFPGETKQKESEAE